MNRRKLTNEEKQARWEKFRPPKRFPILAVLDNIRSAYNVGSMFRTAECAYISGLILCGITARPPHKEVEKTALGTTQLLPWRYFADTLEAVRALRSEGWTIAALEITTDSAPIQTVKPEHFPLALVVGNEVTGVDDRALSEANLVVEIPQYGKKESLNVAVAFGVAIFLLVEKCRASFPS
ncbi:MAG: RNA methyltransferase [Candidatus Bipolaricaulota bacterium]|nr:RNA methyltransferase [Candidatus Bipolaricaulota bacterium]MDW8126679.1 RNA methyltransferase [Candidatus Bipolaricaulota bacterium]